MPLKLLEEMLIGPHRVRVGTLTENTDEESGEADTHANVLKLGPGLAPTVMVETVLHEVVHFLVSGLPLTSDMEEVVAVILGRGLAAFVRDNPAWITLFQNAFTEEDAKWQMK